MRYIIIGAGAVGLALAAEFELAGVEYLLVGRGAQLAHLQDHGLDYERPSGRRVLRLNLSDFDSLATLRHDDVLLLCVKTQDVEATTAAWADKPVAGGGVGADLPLVTLQNGLEAEHIAARRFDRIYGASILVPAVYVETGRVSVWAGPQLAVVGVGRFPEGRDAITAQLVADLARAGSLAEEHEDIRCWKAAKLLHNVKNVVELFSGDAATLALVGQRLSDEALAVLRASGIDPARADERQLDLSGWKVQRADSGQVSGQSTWQSFVRGARSEVDYLNGEVSRLGLLAGVPTPWNRAAQRLAAQLAVSGGAPGSIAITRLVTAAGTPAATAAR